MTANTSWRKAKSSKRYQVHFWYQRKNQIYLFTLFLFLTFHFYLSTAIYLHLKDHPLSKITFSYLKNEYVKKKKKTLNSIFNLKEKIMRPENTITYYVRILISIATHCLLGVRIHNTLMKLIIFFKYINCNEIGWRIKNFKLKDN